MGVSSSKRNGRGGSSSKLRKLNGHNNNSYEGPFVICRQIVPDEEPNETFYGPEHNLPATILIERHPVSYAVNGSCDTFAHDLNRQIAKAIEAFMNVLQYTVVTAELLPHITFLHSGDFPSTDSQSQAFHRLCTLINQSEVPGKWQTLIIALELADYKYVVNLLRGEIDNDGHEDREILNIFRPIIIKNINTAEVLDKLYERKVLNEQDYEEIQAELKRRGDIAAACMLIDKVPRREPNGNWLSIFVRILRELKMDFLADQLDVPIHTKSSVSVNSEPMNGGAKQIQGAVEYSTTGTLRKTSVSNEYTSAAQLKTRHCDPPPLPARSKQVYDRNPDKGGTQTEYADQQIARDEVENAYIYNQTLHEERKDLDCSVDLTQRHRDQRSEQLRLEMQVLNEYKVLCNAREAELQRLNEPSPQTSEIHHCRERLKILDGQLSSSREERIHSLRTELRMLTDVGNGSASNEEENHYTSTFDVEIRYQDEDHSAIGTHVDAELGNCSEKHQERIVCESLNCLIVKSIDTPTEEQSENYEEPYHSSAIRETLAQTVQCQGNKDLESSENVSIDAEYETTVVEKQTSATSEITELKQRIGELTLIWQTSNATIEKLQSQLEEVKKIVRNEKAESDSHKNVDYNHGYVACMQPPTES